MMTLRSQQLISRIITITACWLGFALGFFWVWQGFNTLRPHAILDRYSNPMLIVIGLVVWAAVIGLFRNSRATAVLLILYALLQEILLQQYNYSHFGYIKFKPYFPVEIIGLVLAAIGVFWNVAVSQRPAARTAKSRHRKQ